MDNDKPDQEITIRDIKTPASIHFQDSEKEIGKLDWGDGAFKFEGSAALVKGTDVDGNEIFDLIEGMKPTQLKFKTVKSITVKP
jgi:hypothetical protein